MRCAGFVNGFTEFKVPFTSAWTLIDTKDDYLGAELDARNMFYD